ncbi:HK97 gp10 family phage protein [Pasteurella multocida]|uniref:HK97-gp10 family putative phage morphogenesis protein n=1 Tax=Pasteurella multocida TaxID=747 RepID=UPI0020257147|nr:HK97-gp10 family putative phage morphogenesis protein [Pasteurella multocida]URJ84950.1 HK97 gp10 family phage protein [Pasteurella multocida]
MASVTVKIKGLKQLQQAMDSLGRKTSNRIAVKAMRKGGAIVRDKARQNAPVLKENVSHRRAGTLRKAISTRTKVSRGGKTHTYIWVKGLSIKQVLKFKDKTGKAGAYNPKDPFYWRFVEFGTSKMPAQPFLRPAFEQTKRQATKEIIETLHKEIIQEGTK